MRHVFLLAGLLLALPACAHLDIDPSLSLPPGGAYDVRDVYYDVTGESVEEIRASLRRDVHPDVDPYLAIHRWTPTWAFTYEEDGPSCRIVDVRIDVQSVTIMPRWTAGPDTPAYLRASWQVFIDALDEHERGHQAIAFAAMRAIHKKLVTMRALGCGSMSAKANEAARAIFHDYRERNRRYDIETGHGATQGVAWPPPPDSVAAYMANHH